MFSYTGNPADSDRDAVRFLTQQTEESTSYVDDKEIDWALTQESGIYNAAALVCETIAGKAAQSGGSWVRGRVEVRTDAVSAQFLDLAQRLRTLARGTTNFDGASAYAGGISVEGKTAVEAEADRVEPRFYRGQFE